MYWECPVCGREYNDAEKSEIKAWTKRLSETGYCCDLCEEDNKPVFMTLSYGWNEGKFVMLVVDTDGGKILHRISLSNEETMDLCQNAAALYGTDEFISVHDHKQME